jgi:hypothetical protein
MVAIISAAKSDSRANWRRVMGKRQSAPELSRPGRGWWLDRRMGEA